MSIVEALVSHIKIAASFESKTSEDARFDLISSSSQGATTVNQ